MSKIFNKRFILILIIAVFTSIFASDSNKNSRLLEDVTELFFSDAKNLTFNTDSRWQFNISYNGVSELTLESIHFISIIYKGSPTLATCQVESGFILNCYVNEEDQTILDLIQINHQLTNGATIRWTNLNQIYDILIYATLKYDDSFFMSYHFVSSSNKYWDFKIKIQEKILPENGIVKVDLFFTSEELVVATCIHNNFYLNCKFNHDKPANFLIQISPIKYEGSIEWENLENNITVPLSVKGRVFVQVDSLEFINNIQWNYILKFASSSSLDLGGLSSLITVNTKIVSESRNQYLYLTRCYLINTITEAFHYKCIVYGEHQELKDLVYISHSNENEVSVDWGNALKSDQLISRNAELTFVKIYDLEYINRDWSFKILVRDDEDLPENCLVFVDVVNLINDGNIYSTCSFRNHILNCNKLSSTSSSNTYLIRFQSEKIKGSITWKNIRDKHISIPLNYQLELIKANNGFFTDRWNFLIYATYKGDAPKSSLIVIDIIQDSKETTASCELLRQGSNNLKWYIFCISNLENQSISDIIIINSSQKSGSVTWTNTIGESNNKVEKFSNSKSKSLDFCDAYDMYYANNKWFFTVITNTFNAGTDNIGIYKIDITVKQSSSEIKSTASCLIIDGIDNAAKIKLLCSCDYSDQSKDDLIKISYEKTESSTVTWLSGITSDYSITLKTVLTIKKGDNLDTKEDHHWIFDIEIELNENTILPVGSKVITDVDLDTQTQHSANCTAETNNKLSCYSTAYGTEEPKIAYLKSLTSSITWTNENEEDYYILRRETLSLLSVDYLYFLDNKWHFNISTSGLYAAKVIVDILYNDIPSTATCYGGKNRLISCIVDYEHQEKSAIIKLSKQKTELSTITWYNLNEDKDISLWTELTLDKIANLHMDEEGLNWIFDIYIIEDDIPEGSYIVTDIQLYYYSGGDEIYAKRKKSIAKCYHSNKKLECKVIFDRSNIRLFEYTPSLVRTKNYDSISSVIKWKNMPNEIMPIPLTANLKYFYANKIIKENDKNIFYIELDQSTKVPKESFCTIDIIIDNENELGNCLSQNHTTLKCEIDTNIDLTNKKVYIAKDKSLSSSITWTNLIENQYLFPINLTFIHAYNFRDVPYTNAYFQIIAAGKELKNNLIIPIKIWQLRNAKISSTILYEKVMDISCECKHYVLFCHWYNSKGIYADKDKYYLKLNEKGDTIEWNNPGDYDYIPERESFALHYNNLIYCYYDEFNNYYKYSLQLSSNSDHTGTQIMDLYINDEHIYGICNITQENKRQLECYTPYMPRNNNDRISFQNGYDTINGLGVIDWRDISTEQIIYPNEFDFADISKMYDLKYNIDKWEFKMKYDYISDFEGTKKIVISVSDEDGEADCVKESDTIIKCSSETLSNDKLIQINNKFKSNDYLCLYTNNNFKIPLASTLELINLYKLKYENNWSFELKIKSTEGLIFPRNSSVTIDIIYDDNNNKDLAFCDEINRDSNTIILLCIPEKVINKESLIKISNQEKSEYASVTWAQPISKENTYISVELKLFVEYVTMPEYNLTDSLWKFNMIFSVIDTNKDSNIRMLEGIDPGTMNLPPLDTKVIIDIKYNENEEEYANCHLINQNQFECIPNIISQNINDKFTILGGNIKYGTVTFLNPLDRLEFIIYLFYSKLDNYTVGRNYSYFEIELSESNMKEGNNIEIDILIDYNNSKANCIIEENILKCESYYIEKYNPKQITIINDTINDNYKWINLPNLILYNYDYEDVQEIPETTIITDLITYSENITYSDIFTYSDIYTDLNDKGFLKIYGYYFNFDEKEKVYILEQEEDESGDIEDEILINIRKRMNETINYTYINDGHYFYVEYNNKTRYIFSKSEQKDGLIPSINLDECLNRLKTNYNIYNNIIYILYIEMNETNMQTSKILYEMYSLLESENKFVLLNLDVCEGINIEIEKIINISADDLDLYNLSSGYYNDKCYTSTSENGTDIILDDRLKQYYKNNMSICEDNCVFTSYDSNTGKAKCSCPISKSISSISDIKLDMSELKHNFKDIYKGANFYVLKCYEKLFSNTIFKNIGSIFIACIIILGIISIFIFYCHSFNLFKNQIKNVFEMKKFQKDDISEKTQKKLKKTEIIEVKSGKTLGQFPPKKSLIEKNSENDKISCEENEGVRQLPSNSAENSRNSNVIESDTREETDISDKIKNYNDSEMNTLSYKNAYKYDKRTFCEYYISLLKTKHLLIFSFYTTNDYNSRLIKINFFFLNFAVNFAVNALFFDDSTMHKIYEDGGKYGFQYHIVIIICSTIISSIIITLVKISALTENNVLEIKNAKSKDLIEVYNSETKTIKRKFVIFFIIIFILLLFFWYYVGCFCAVYINTQSKLLIDTVMSFCISLLYPIVILLIPGIFRINALRDEKQEHKCMYNFSKFIQACL